MNSEISLAASILTAILLLGETTEAVAQVMTSAKPGRTVYKCNFNGKVVYTDDPCAGAERIDVEPTRGLNRSSGKELTGKDVAREKQTEMFAEAVKPVTRVTPKQFELERSRVNLAPEVKSECRRLDYVISDAEAKEKVAGGTERSKYQNDLLVFRKRFREINC